MALSRAPPPKYVAEGYAFILLRLRSRGPKSGDFYSLRTLATEKNDQNGHVGPDLQIHNIVDTDIHRVSKNVPRLVCYNFDTLERIWYFLAEMLPIKYAIKSCFLPPQISCAFAPHGKTRKHKNLILTQMLYYGSARNNYSLLDFFSYLTHDSYSHCCITP